MFGLPDEVVSLQFERDAILSRKIRKEVYTATVGGTTLYLMRALPRKLGLWYVKEDTFHSRPVAYSSTGLSTEQAIQWVQQRYRPDSRFEAILSLLDVA